MWAKLHYTKLHYNVGIHHEVASKAAEKQFTCYSDCTRKKNIHKLFLVSVCVCVYSS